jgi:hypothetical protein
MWPGLGVHRRDDPVGGHPLGDAPGAVLLAGLDVLAGDQRQQPDRVGLLGAEGDAVQRVDQGEGVIDQPGDERLLGHGVVPGDGGLGPGVVVVRR